jgi:hypothetical protein
MKFRVEVVYLREDGEQRHSVLEMERSELAIRDSGAEPGGGQGHAA